MKLPDLPELPAPIAVEPWTETFPWLVHGTTTRGFDLRLFGDAPAAGMLERWEALRLATEMDRVVHSRQVHGVAVRVHRGSGAGLSLAPPADGHLTREPGTLLTVTVADCVPVFMVAPAQRVIALVHAGWRGVAAGILESATRSFETRFGIDAEALHLHLGPSIGAGSYEVGPEVFEALGLTTPDGPSLLDLRGVLRTRAEDLGIARGRITASDLDTLDEPSLFSHRGGDTGRQVAFLGIRDPLEPGR